MTENRTRTHGRVLVRPAHTGDREAFLDLRSSSGRFLTKWEPSAGKDSKGRDHDEVLFERMFDLDGGRRKPLLVVRKEDEKPLGVININEISRGVFQNCALGWWIGREHAGQGYMHEGLAATLSHVFLDLGLHRAEANIQPENTPSTSLAERVGMVLEGRSERYLKIRGRWRDHERWAITIETWRRSRQKGD